MNEGKIVQIIGPVVDIDFSGGKLPEIMNAVTNTKEKCRGNRRRFNCRSSAAIGGRPCTVQ